MPISDASLRALAAVLFGLLTALSATANAPEADAPRRLDAVEVAGNMPGPSLWQVSDGEHTLWLMGRISPLPKRMQWRSDEVAGVIRQADAYIDYAAVQVEAKIGFFSGLMLLPKALGARKPLDNKTLQQQVSAAAYARWLPLKKRYLGSSRRVEKWRPLFAVDRLRNKALKKSGLTERDQVASALLKLAKKNDLEIIRPRVKVTIDDPKKLLEEFRATAVADLDCFEQTLTWLESDLDLLRRRANAWAVGDIERLRELQIAQPRSACIDALLKAESLQRRGFADLAARLDARWLEVAEAALKTHRSTLAVVSMDDLLNPEGYLAELRRRGYRVVEPE
jgi:uncharacterized protein YbaP (TraB family)